MRETLAQVHGRCRAERGAPRTSPKGGRQTLGPPASRYQSCQEKHSRALGGTSFTSSFFTLLWKGQSKVSPNNADSSLMAASPSLPSPAADAGPWPTQTSVLQQDPSSSPWSLKY